jgi:hypothetical protein
MARGRGDPEWHLLGSALLAMRPPTLRTCQATVLPLQRLVDSKVISVPRHLPRVVGRTAAQSSSLALTRACGLSKGGPSSRALMPRPRRQGRLQAAHGRTSTVHSALRPAERTAPRPSPILGPRPPARPLRARPLRPRSACDRHGDRPRAKTARDGGARLCLSVRRRINRMTMRRCPC